MALPKKTQEINPIKMASMPEWLQQKIRADEAAAKSARVQGSSLKAFSDKRLKALGGKTLYSTFTLKSGRRPLDYQRRIRGRCIKSVRTQGYTLKRTKPLNLEGVRGRRLRPGDRKAGVECRGLGCVCGCSLPVQWAHLETRRYVSTRHDFAYSIPACAYLHPWLDQGKGRKCRTQLLRTAREFGRRLTHEDVYQMLIDCGYYADLAQRRLQER